ncbi:MAG TPA: mersacidin/lichenicidin family type 2 lantibiotic [Blastocatellia bacterium]|jgi:mersacidin/lichenicidin family type 2 lantibiotic|nr:mersacidin/lichenicidin family type 2 lantibiotic [Blastocatellia bacterium]
MCRLDVIRAWKDEDYRMSLSEAERRMLPTNPAGLIDISDSELGAVAGGLEAGGMSFPGVCSCFGGCQSEFYGICSGDWAPCTGGPFYCPLFPVDY